MSDKGAHVSHPFGNKKKLIKIQFMEFLKKFASVVLFFYKSFIFFITIREYLLSKKELRFFKIKVLLNFFALLLLLYLEIIKSITVMGHYF